MVLREVRTEINHERACLKPGQGYLLSPDILHHDPRLWKNPDTFDPTPKGTLITIDKGNCGPCYQHNGASLEIGPDGAWPMPP